jgi:hypothetical protein
MSQFVIVDETSKAMVFGGNKSALKDAQQPAASPALRDELGVEALAWKERAEAAESEVKSLQRRVEILERLKIAQSIDMANSTESVLRSTARDEIYRAKLNELLNAAAAQEAVAYLDIGAGGYLDIGSDLPEEQLLALPKGRHMLGIIGTYGVDGYVPADSPKVGSEARAL